jgi:hypothetical protein
MGIKQLKLKLDHSIKVSILTKKRAATFLPTGLHAHEYCITETT